MEIQPQRWGANLALAGQSWLAAITAITRLGINGRQCDNEREQINILNTAYLLIILPIWLVLCSSYWLAEHWPAGLVMAVGVVALSALVVLHSQGRLGLRNYGQCSLPLVFLIPIAVALALGGPPGVASRRTGRWQPPCWRFCWISPARPGAGSRF